MSLPNDKELIARLVARDEDAFALLIDTYHTSLVRLAQYFVGSQSTAEEVVQETWMAVIKGLPKFEGRSALKTWIYKILTNRAKTRGQREGRQIPFSSLGANNERAVDAERFSQRGMWISPPELWGDPDRIQSNHELQRQIAAAITKLPDNQASVITLRDIQGWSSEEICNVLDISESNLRVLLHRARSRLRQSLERYYIHGESLCLSSSLNQHNVSSPSHTSSTQPSTE